MKRPDFCRQTLQSGIDADPRGRAAIERELQESKSIYDDLTPEQRAMSDLETFSYPYTDNRTFPSSPEQNVNTVFAGIDMEMPELLIAGRLNEKGAAFDAVYAHFLFMFRSRSLFLFTTACPG